ncbi:MAG: TlpA family protein disulfide reductase, partial [Pseudomonadota bacterium]
STDRGNVTRINQFFEEIEIQHLGVYRDKKSELAREAGAFGLPMTIILNREGREVARLLGEAEWDSTEAKAVVRKLAEPG